MYGDRRARHGALTANRAARGSIGRPCARIFCDAEQREGLRRQPRSGWVQRVASWVTALQRMAKTDPSSDVRAHVHSRFL